MLETIWNFVCFHPEITVIGAITLIQIAPIKLNPWGALVKTIKNFLVGGIEKKLGEIGTKVDNLEKQIKEDKAIHARAHILRFADGIYNGKQHTKEYFDDILSDIDEYEEYCHKHPEFKNGKTIMSVELIRNTYHTLIENHGFKGEK